MEAKVIFETGSRLDGRGNVTMFKNIKVWIEAFISILDAILFSKNIGWMALYLRTIYW